MHTAGHGSVGMSRDVIYAKYQRIVMSGFGYACPFCYERDKLVYDMGTPELPDLHGMWSTMESSLVFRQIDRGGIGTGQYEGNRSTFAP